MATAIRPILRRAPPRLLRHSSHKPPSQRRLLHSCPPLLAPDDDDETPTTSRRATTAQQTDPAELEINSLTKHAGLPRQAAEQFVEMTQRMDSLGGRETRDQEEEEAMLSELLFPEEGEVERESPGRRGFFAEGEGAEDMDEDPEFEPDDISTTAHGELEQQRELREFARVVVWDAPMLWHHRKPFQPPDKQTSPLRFRYTTYMGETHPGSRKVAMDFSPHDLPDLTHTQRDKLIKLLGARYDPYKQQSRISSDQFPTSAQNKRHTLDVLDKLLYEARYGRDSFEDVPFDFRHAKDRRKLVFPEAWKMTEERKEELRAKRGGVGQLDKRTGSAGDEAVAQKLVEPGEPVRAMGEEQMETVRVGAGRPRTMA
ncbi:MAG: 37S ribosomal protein S24, mitochondrial [Alyxoria varia]|nr:MAG: 37S ribosomal protein S24, mitochondrial [Alyxoria varia]